MSDTDDLMGCVVGVPILIVLVGVSVAGVVCAAGFSWWLIRFAWSVWQ